MSDVFLFLFLSPDAIDGRYTPLMYARGTGSTRTTSVLIDHGASSMLRASPVVSLWRHITYTTERPKTNLRDALYVGVTFALEPDEEDTIHGNQWHHCV